MLVYQAAAFESSRNASPPYTRGECTTCVQPPPPFSKRDFKIRDATAVRRDRK